MAVFRFPQAIATCLVSFLTVMASAKAADFSFTGNLSVDNPVQFFGFTLSTESTVTLRTFSYAGGTQANGNTVSAGGFDPVVTLLNPGTSSASVIAFNDDGFSVVPTDPNTGLGYDSLLAQSLAPGNYAVALSQFPNFPTFQGGYSPNNSRTSNWALDILNVDTANVTAPISVENPVPVAMNGF